MSEGPRIEDSEDDVYSRYNDLDEILNNQDFTNYEDEYEGEE